MLVNVFVLSQSTGLSVYTLRKMVKSGAIPYVEIGTADRPRWRFDVAAVQDALSDRAETSRAQRATVAEAARAGF